MSRQLDKRHAVTTLALAWGALAFGAVYAWAFWPLAVACALGGAHALLLHPTLDGRVGVLQLVVCAHVHGHSGGTARQRDRFDVADAVGRSRERRADFDRHQARPHVGIACERPAGDGKAVLQRIGKGLPEALGNRGGNLGTRDTALHDKRGLRLQFLALDGECGHEGTPAAGFEPRPTSFWLVERQVIEREARTGRLRDLGVACANLGRHRRPGRGPVALRAATEPARKRPAEHLVAAKPALERDVHHAVGGGDQSRGSAIQPQPLRVGFRRLADHPAERTVQVKR